MNTYEPLKRLFPLLVILLTIGGSTMRGQEAAPQIEMPTRGICAHRGASDTHPENTLAAFHQAIRLGAQMIEFDVASSKDGQLVLMHDATVDRTTDGQGLVSDLTLSELQMLTSRSQSFAF